MSSKIRLLHGCPQSPYLDAFCGTQHLCQNVCYNGCSEYCEIDYGSYNIIVCPPRSQHRPLIDAYTYLPDSSYHTAVVSGGRDNMNLFVVPDSHSQTSTTKAFLRFVNLAYDTPCLDFRFTDGAFIIANNIQYKEITQYYPVTPSTYQMQATLCNSNFVVLSVPSITLQPGRSYTIYITGSTRQQPYCSHMLCFDGQFQHPGAGCLPTPSLPSAPTCWPNQMPCGCSSCQNNWQPDCGCSSWPNNWQPDCGCSSWPNNWQPDCGCSSCQNSWQPDCGCSSCQNSWQPDCGCSSCQNNWQPDCGCSSWPNDCSAPTYWDSGCHSSGGSGWSSDAISYGSSYTHYYNDSCRSADETDQASAEAD